MTVHLARDYCFTSFELSFTPEKISGLAYASWQLEECPDTKRKHIQGYVEFKEKVDFKTVKKALPEGAHIEKRKGTQKQAIEYTCKADSQVEPGWEWGTMHKQGARNDLKAMKEAIDEGMNLADVAQNFFECYLKYRSSIKEYYFLTMKRREKMPEVFILWGKPGTGKTRQIYEDYGYDQVYSKDNHKWWDGYMGQKCILIDDLDNDWWQTRQEWLKLLDRNPLDGQTKNGFIKINSPVICITMNKDPKTFKYWDDAFERRVKHIYDK